MKQAPDVKVGILTQGTPRIAGLRVLNALMGKGFHWQRCFSLLLPPEAAIVSRSPLIASMPVEAYLRCVVGSEMNPAAPMEFLRAHAIVSRSWVLGKMLHIHAEDTQGQKNSPHELRTWADTAAHTLFHVCNDDHCQRFQGVQQLADTLEEALRSTESLVLADDGGNVVDARFSKCCGGRTELFSTCWQDVDYPYLQSVADPWCAPEMLPEGALATVLKDYDADTTPDYFRWQERVSARQIEERLRIRFGRSAGHIAGLKPLLRGPSGRIHSLLIEGSEGSIAIGKELAIRRLLSQTHLFSSAFNIHREQEDVFLLSGKGWGHGVGLCQIGAAAMAWHGKTCAQILAHYYPGTRIMTAEAVLPDKAAGKAP